MHTGDEWKCEVSSRMDSLPVSAVPDILVDDAGLRCVEYRAVVFLRFGLARDHSRTETDEWDSVRCGEVSYGYFLRSFVGIAESAMGVRNAITGQTVSCSFGNARCTPRRAAVIEVSLMDFAKNRLQLSPA